ncbi:hypothetical protein MES4922_160106 [Mesorhizobium ventifaucium]|uniref:Flavodoxin-like domain-containing protein n=1 Tax=Mesorhizobium ventifaucium TaxID=666020 RepID=A0ABM9DI35_9HYPH|nr:hypothetical protein MES4922_160106 [Mesorhizobium ventifaucium]
MEGVEIYCFGIMTYGHAANPDLARLRHLPRQCRAHAGAGRRHCAKGSNRRAWRLGGSA